MEVPIEGLQKGLSQQERSRLNRASIDLVYDFGASKLRESMPPNATFVLIPTDNPLLEAINREAAERIRKKGDSVLMIAASRQNPGEPYTQFSTLQSRQPERPV